MNEEGWDLKVRDGTEDTLYQFYEDKAEESAYGLNLNMDYKKLHLTSFVGRSYIMNGYAEQGIHINFFVDIERMRFQINHKAVQAAGLEMSYHLLKLAKPVHSEGNG